VKLHRNLVSKIGWRYVFSRHATQAVNIISAVSMLGIVVGSAALIIVLSAFNGFEELVKKLYASFYPDLSIQLVEGKHFSADSLDLETLRAVPGVAALSCTLEENAILVYREKEHIAMVKGVDEAFAEVTAVDDSVIIGQYRIGAFRPDSVPLDYAVLGAGVADVLDIMLGPQAGLLSIYMPRRSLSAGMGTSRAFREQRIRPQGVFRIQQEFDARYVIVPLRFMQELLEYRDNRIGAVEVRLEPGASARRVQRELQAQAGSRFQVLTRYQLNPTVYRVMRTEKWAVYLVLTFIVVVAAFNMIGSLSMLVIEKRRDIGTLRALGAGSSQIQGIFLFEGLLQTLLSMGMGFSLALALLLGQIWFQWLKIPGSGTFVVQAYPVAIQLADFVLVTATILVIGLAASWFPARQASATRYVLHKE
jgi:lipoprotein-releasing system permease protein